MRLLLSALLAAFLFTTASHAEKITDKDEFLEKVNAAFSELSIAKITELFYLDGLTESDKEETFYQYGIRQRFGVQKVSVVQYAPLSTVTKEVKSGQIIWGASRGHCRYFSCEPEGEIIVVLTTSRMNITLRLVYGKVGDAYYLAGLKSMKVSSEEEEENYFSFYVNRAQSLTTTFRYNVSGIDLEKQFKGVISGGFQARYITSVVVVSDSDDAHVELNIFKNQKDFYRSTGKGKLEYHKDKTE